METIYKYQLETTDEQLIEMPIGAEILTVQTQNGTPCIWAKVNTKNANFKYQFRIFGTGHPIESDFRGKYIGTYQLSGGALIFHVYFCY